MSDSTVKITILCTDKLLVFQDLVLVFALGLSLFCDKHITGLMT